MRNALIAVMLVVVVMSSCKKDDTGSDSQNLLAKIVTKQGSDSTVVEYNYDSQLRFIQEKTTSVDASGAEINTISLVRDANGRATKLTEAVSGSGTYVTDYAYVSPSDKKLRNGIYRFDYNGTQVTDSIAFAYATKVSKTTHYYSAVGVPSTQAYYYEYTYDTKGNMTQAKLYQPNSSGTTVLSATINFEYDNKINPIYFNDDVLVEYLGYQYTSPSNITKVNVVGADPADNFTATSVYEYRADGRPTKATTTADGSTYVAVYTYKN